MCPDDSRVRIVLEQNKQGFFVTVRMQIQVTLDGEVDHLLHPVRLGGFSVDVEFTDAALVAARILILDEIEYRRIVEPGLDVIADAIGPDEWHDPELGPFCIHELLGAFVGPAGCDNAGDAVAAKHLAHLVERVKWPGLQVIVQVRVEDAEEADAIFTKLMGDEVLPRKTFIQCRAREVELEELDV